MCAQYNQRRGRRDISLGSVAPRGRAVFPPFPPTAKAPPQGGPPLIRPGEANDRDADAFARHLVEHMAESGRDGAPHFAPSRRLGRDEIQAAALARWSKSLDEALWGRAFLLCAEQKVVGH